MLKGTPLERVYLDLIRPVYKKARRFSRNYLSGVFSYILLMIFFSIGFELFVNRRVHQPLVDYCCKKEKQRPKAPQGARDVARQERIKMIEMRLKEKAEEEK